MEIKNCLDGSVIRTVASDSLYGANLSRANLYGADLSGANLSRANLYGADLYGADLSGAGLNWQSHDLIAEILRRAAGDSVARRQIAGMILVSRDWCWRDFLAIDHTEKDWALAELRKWQSKDNHCRELAA